MHEMQVLQQAESCHLKGEMSYFWMGIVISPHTMHRDVTAKMTCSDRAVNRHTGQAMVLAE
jgi:hypothetical protein